MRRVVASWLALAVVAAPGLAYAGDKAAAQALFDEARRLMQAGDFAKACPMLEDSEREDPGVGTLFNLADCDEKLGRTATAWALFLEVATKTQAQNQPERAAVARQRAAAIEPHLPRLAIVVEGDHAPMLAVTRDGAPVGQAQWGLPIPVDPGTHTIRATAPGRLPWQSSIVVHPGGATTTILVSPLPVAETSATSASEPPTPVAPPAAEVEKPLPPRTASTGFGTQRVVALAIGGAGVVSLAVSGAFGLMSLAKHNDSVNEGCNAQSQCPPQAVPTRRAAVDDGNVATATLIAGLAAAATGVVVWLTAPRPKVSGTSLGIAPAPGGMGVVGRF